MDEILSMSLLDSLGLQVTDETMSIMVEKKVHLYNLKKDPDCFITNYDIVHNKKLPPGAWIIVRHQGKRSSQLYFSSNYLYSSDNPIDWLYEMIVLFQKLNK